MAPSFSKSTTIHFTWSMNNQKSAVAESSRMTSSKTKLLAVLPMITGSISSVASFTIIICILRSNTKLSTTYRRLVFGISAYDLLQSLSQAFSSVPMPVGAFWLASGNDATCTIQGFVNTMGFGGTIFYSLSLTIFFLLVIKYDVDDAKIKKYAEPIFHAVPVLFSAVVSIYAFATNNYNTSGSVCWINSRPLNCYEDPDVDCISKGNPETLRWISGGPIFIIFFSNCVMMVMIWFSVYFQTKKSQAYRYSWMSSPTPASQNRPAEQGGKGGASTTTSRSSLLSTRSKETEQISSPLAARLSRPSPASIRRLRETSNRAIAYILGFLLTYFFTIMYRFIEKYSSNPVPFAIIILSRIFYPLQGKYFKRIVHEYPCLLLL